MRSLAHATLALATLAAPAALALGCGGADPTSWNSAHATSGCSAAAFAGTGGRGSIYCFAAD